MPNSEMRSRAMSRRHPKGPSVFRLWRTMRLLVLGVLPLGTAASACGSEDEAILGRHQQALSPVTVSFQNGVLPSSSYSGTTDATIRQSNPASNYGGSTTCEADGDDGGGTDKSCLLRWDVSTIPSGSTVQSAFITLRIVNASSNTYNLYELERSWSEAAVTWNNATSSTPWASPGAMGSSDRGSLVGTISGATGSKTVSLNAAGIAMVQAWVDGTSNSGIVIAHVSNTNGIDFASSEHGTASYRPTLAVTYLPPGGGGAGGSSGVGGSPGSGGASSGTLSFQNGVAPAAAYAGSTDATIREASPTTNAGSATTCESDGDDGGGSDKSCALRWDVSGVPAGSVVQSASITLQIVDESSNTYNLYELRRGWSESSVTWNDATESTAWSTPGAQGSADRGSIVGTVSGAVGSATIALNSAGIAMVQGWVDGTSNSGVIVADSSSTNGIDFASSEHATLSYRPRLTITYGSGSGGSGGSGSTGDSTAPDLLVAFIGDQGNNGNSDAVLNLIKSEGAAATVHNGDFDYADNPAAWNDRIDAILGPNYPYFAIIGNHDAAAWAGSNGYASYIAARHARVPEMDCTGELGVKASCTFRGLHLIQSCVGVNELRSSCNANSSEQVNFIRDTLSGDDSVWTVCNWHKNQHDMQVGGKANEVGWSAYRECMNAGAIVATGHEHSYSRTLTLTDVGNASVGHGAAGAFDAVELAAGRNFVFVSGLAGVGIRDFEGNSHDDDTWWASYYASNRWMKNGVTMSGTARYGALFIRFHVDGNPRRARGYFKDVNGRLADEFVIHVD